VRLLPALIPSLLVIASWLSGCDEPADGNIPASRIAEGGFASEPGRLQRWLDREIRLSGYVDHGNLYGDTAARQILQEWWGGDGPAPDVWRFDLKASPDDPVGHGFAVHVGSDAGTAELLRRLVDDARAGRPTWVSVRGRLRTFAAPTQAARLTGLYVVAGASSDVSLGPARDTDR